MTPVGFETTLAVPSWFVADTRERSVWPTSPCVRMCALVVSPGIAAQLTPLLPPPDASQRSQRYRNENGVVPDQLPFEVLSVLPSIVVPEIRGCPVGFGAACERAEPPAGISSDAPTIPTVAAAASTRTRRPDGTGTCLCIVVSPSCAVRLFRRRIGVRSLYAARKASVSFGAFA
jgi:hypothetical protein